MKLFITKMLVTHIRNSIEAVRTVLNTRKTAKSETKSRKSRKHSFPAKTLDYKGSIERLWKCL